MLERRPAEKMGVTSFRGADSIHHFCYGRYQSPERLNWGCLRVLNRVRLDPGAKRDPHPLGGMEVVLLVETGEIEIQCGDRKTQLPSGGCAVLAMGLGADYGVLNVGDVVTEFIEIWFNIDAPRDFPKVLSARLPVGTAAIASLHAADEAPMTLQSPVRVSQLMAVDSAVFQKRLEGEHSYLSVLAGEAIIGGLACRAGDAIALHDEMQVTIEPNEGCEILAIEYTKPLTSELRQVLKD